MIEALATPDRTIYGRRLLGRFFAMPEWERWRIVVKAAFGLPLTAEELPFFQAVSGRTTAPTRRCRELWVISGRRSGKTATASGIAAHVAAFHDFKRVLRPGERATVMCLATDRAQAKILLEYIRAYFREVPALSRLVVAETKEGVELSTGAEILVHTASFRSVRGKANALTLLDECAFWRSDESANPDVEIYRALLPNHATLDGMIVGISSPYRASGLLFDKWSQNWGRDDSDVLVIRGPSLTFNSTLDPKIIEAAYAQDAVVAACEWGSEWRRDVEGFINAEVVKAAVVPNRFELAPAIGGIRYVAFADPAAGGKDKFAFAIAHAEGEKIVLDVARELRASNPTQVVAEYCALLKLYGLSTVTGDRYAGQWVAEAFGKNGITYKVSDKSKSELYIEFLPLLNSGRVELLDNTKLVAQICSLERTVTRGTGRETVDAPRGASEDLANAAAGALVFAKTRRPMIISAEVLAAAMRPGPRSTVRMYG